MGLTMLLGLAGCTDDGSQDDILDVAFQSQVSNLDRTFTTKREYIILSQLIDDFLFDVDPETLKYEPLLAKSYEFINDTTLDVTLRDGVKFHDGSTLSVKDVLYTYNFVLDPDNGARANRNVSDWLESVEQIGPMTVRFHLSYPYPLALRDMAVTVPIRKAGSYTVDGELDKSALVTRENGLGPYEVVHFLPGREVMLKRFEDYYDGSPKGKPAIRQIRIHTISDWGSAQAGILAGELDWLYNVPGDIARNLDASGYAKRLVGPSMRIGFLQLDAAGLTGENAPLTDLRVRRAVNHAINRQSIVENLVGAGASLIATSCNPVQFGCETDVQRYPYDPRKARELLTEAGYPDGFPLTLWAYRDPYVAEAMAQDLRDVGIDVSLRYVPLPVLNKARSAGEIPAYFGTWGAGGTADVAATLSVMWNMNTDRNLAQDPLIAKLVASAERTQVKETRRQLYSRALKRIADQAYWAPLYVFPQNYVVNKRLGFPVPSDGLPRLYLTHWRSDGDSTSGDRASGGTVGNKGGN
ncbi:ABC transporter substrate-binding protein [Salinicola corii]|uniref:ABC transporter substrate-binding protein n=1 Tax=Salinicola corii TaxID=2606937 RepID=UPI001659D801|nr:ABC transporter substrate-binding protein [Salinicola corii]